MSAGVSPAVDAARRRAGWVLGAAVGFTWGPAAMAFLTSAGPAGAGETGMLAALTLAAGAAGWRVPARWFAVGAWEPGLYRRLGVRAFKGWMMNGDRMNRRLRRLDPAYRFVRGGVDARRAYAEHTRHVERAHLAWMLGALPATGYALATGRAGFAAALLALNAVTNLWPIFLQRYNRGRIERAAAAPRGG